MAGIINLFVDDLFGTGGNEIEQRVQTRLGKNFQVGSEDWNDVTFTGQRIRWKQDSQTGRTLKSVTTGALMSWRKSQWNETRRTTSIALLQCTQCTEAFWDKKVGHKVGHSSNVAKKISRCASTAASPTIGDVKSLNKQARQIKSQPVELQYGNGVF